MGQHLVSCAQTVRSLAHQREHQVSRQRWVSGYAVTWAAPFRAWGTTLRKYLLRALLFLPLQEVQVVALLCTVSTRHTLLIVLPLVMQILVGIQIRLT